MTTTGLQREIDRFLTRTPKSRELQEEAVKWLPGGSSRGTHHDPNPVFVDYGEGHYFYDADGNRYLDFMLNATSLIMGHANPIVVEAIAEQAGRGTGFVGPNERAMRLARILCERVPSLDKVRFVNSGTEATLNAIRAARTFTGRHKIAKFSGAYHGSHEYASVSVKPSADPYGPDGPPATLEFPGQPPSLLEDVVVLPWNDLETCERIVRRNASDLACVIMEPIASTLGFPPTRPAFLEGIRALTTDLDMLLVFDEVQTLRTSPGGAQELLGVVPDLTAMGKMVGGGLPAGAFGGRDDIMELFDPRGGAVIPHAGTFNANPLTMAAGEATLSHMTPDVYARLNALGEMIRGKLRAVFDELEVPSQITGMASFFGIHFNPDEITDYAVASRDDAKLRQTLALGLLNEGIMLGGTVCTLTTETEVDELVDTTRRVIQRVRE